MRCHVCSEMTQPFGKATVLGRHAVQYFQCPRCGFIQTEEPYWLDEAYSEAITRSDLGLVSRNMELARVIPTVLRIFFNRDARFLDYGGGYGMFVRLMRDHGFDFYRMDKYAANLFAAGFDAMDIPESDFELVTAFEVFEHLARPREDIRQMLAYSRNILFSTVLIPSPAPKLDTWWYYGLDHGQHVALYTYNALQRLAQHFNLNVFTDGRSLHLLTEKSQSNIAFSLVTLLGRRAPWVSNLLSGQWRPRSLLPQDYFALTGKYLD